ncbi:MULTISPECIES: type VII secretion protein EccCa [Mycobacterium avium complex (MAC)]
MVETKVPPPSEVPEVVPAGKMQKLLPILMVIAIVGMIGIFFATGLRRMSPFMLLFPLMFLASGAGMMGGYGASGGKKTPEINAERRKYTEMLTKLRGTVHQRAAQQYALLAHTAPPPETLASLIGGPRQWEHTNPERDRTNFLTARVGLNEQKLGGGMTMADTAPNIDLEPVQNVAAQRFFRAHRAVAGMPVKIDLKTHASVQFFGDGDLAGVIRAMLLQLAVFHPPNLVLIAVVTEHAQEWDWIKWLPHNQNPHRNDALGSERMVYAPHNAREGLEEILAGRGGFSADRDYNGDKPWLVVVADRVGAVPGCGEGSEAVTVIRRGGTDESALETTQGARVELAASGRARRRRMSPDDPLKYWVTRADAVSDHDARRIARRMARWRAAGSGHTDTRGEASGPVKTWQALHGIDDPGTMGTSRWVTYRDRDPERMRIPIGWDRSGAPVVVNMKEDSEGGMGSHGLILGYTGSGKSSFVADLLLGVVATHTPEQVNLILVDYKGDGTFPGFEKLNHTVQVLSNIGDKDSVNRLEDVLRGEVERRQRLRKEAGRFKDAASYLKARERGAKIPPFPTLLVVVDEFTALLKDHPEYRDLFEHLARQGRSDRIQLVLATQSLTGVSLGQLESNLGWRIALKTANAQDSSAAIDTKDAYYLTQVGQGYLKVGGAEPKFFEAAHVYEPYFPPTISATRNETKTVGGISGIAKFGITPVGAVHADSKTDQPVAPVTHTRQEIDDAPELITVVLDQLAGQGPPAYKMWLPRLDRPRPVGALVAASGATPGAKAVLRLPIGLIDLPYQHKQDVFSVDLTDSHLVVWGRTRSGKSVALQTLAMSAALLNDPRKVQIYGLDFGGDSKLLALEGLPHVGGVALRGDTDTVNRVLSEVGEVVRRRSEIFRELRVGSMATYRDKVARGEARDDGMGDVILLIDGWDEFRKAHPDAMDQVETLMRDGLAAGVRLVVTVLEWTTLPRTINGLFNTKIELKINDPNLTQVSKRAAEAVPHNIPGRGLDAISAKHIMIGAPRLDDTEVVDDAGLAVAIEQLRQRFEDQQARTVRVLPTRLEAAALRMPERWGGSRWSVPVGMYEKDLSTAMVDFMAERHLNIFGAKNCGKTHLLASMMKSLTARYSPHEVKFLVVDLKSSRLLDAVDEDYLLRWEDQQGRERSGLILNSSELEIGVHAIANGMANRQASGEVTREQRRNRSWWQGPEIFIFVDDYAMVNNAAPSVFAPLAPFWGSAEQVGVHSVVACPIAVANRVLPQGASLMKLNNDAGAATLVMDGVKEHGPFIAGVRVTPRPPGRGVLSFAGELQTIQTPVVPELENT